MKRILITMAAIALGTSALAAYKVTPISARPPIIKNDPCPLC